jgi:hypothetical protein
MIGDDAPQALGALEHVVGVTPEYPVARGLIERVVARSGEIAERDLSRVRRRAANCEHVASSSTKKAAG